MDWVPCSNDFVVAAGEVVALAGVEEGEEEEEEAKGSFVAGTHNRSVNAQVPGYTKSKLRSRDTGCIQTRPCSLQNVAVSTSMSCPVEGKQEKMLHTGAPAVNMSVFLRGMRTIVLAWHIRHLQGWRVCSRVSTVVLLNPR
jgi:hypothetical protein